MTKSVMVIILTLICILIFFLTPYSRFRAEFGRIITDRTAKAPQYTDVFSEEDIRDLPIPVQKYFRYCGYLGTPKMSYMKASFRNVDFMLTDEKKIKIDYTQYNFVEKPERFAYIDSSFFGVPFEGLDSYGNGVGSMKGSLAKLFTLFDQRGEAMDQASLVTFLAECLLIPNAALQDYISWEEIDENHAKAIIDYYGTSGSGIFTFADNGALQSFRTADRLATEMDGSVRNAEWSATFEDYQEENGIKKPRQLQAIWHFPEGDQTYFNENKADIIIEFH
jgi:hypothetical protein